MTTESTERAYRTVLYYQQYEGEKDTARGIEELAADLVRLGDEYGVDVAQSIREIELLGA